MTRDENKDPNEIEGAAEDTVEFEEVEKLQDMGVNVGVRLFPPLLFHLLHLFFLLDLLSLCLCTICDIKFLVFMFKTVVVLQYHTHRISKS